MPTSSRIWPADQQYFYNPANGDVGLDNAVYQFNFIIPQNQAFSQTSGTTYWLGMGLSGGFYDEFGWKTSTDHWNDNAVYFNNSINFWYDLHYFSGHPYAGQSMDLAFVLTGPPAPIPAGVILFGTGLLGLMGFEVRRRR